ncbi:hypothetical protein CDD83_10760 [Cordyceps sp. RAO-2017]|nr:hypothetical protein CDD83_10760 [Cordyceps sp. RAO-2017]
MGLILIGFEQIARLTTHCKLNGIPGAEKRKPPRKAGDDFLRISAMQSDGSIGLAYFYCDGNRGNHQDPPAILRRLVRQLCAPLDNSNDEARVETNYSRPYLVVDGLVVQNPDIVFYVDEDVHVGIDYVTEARHNLLINDYATHVRSERERDGRCNTRVGYRLRGVEDEGVPAPAAGAGEHRVKPITTCRFSHLSVQYYLENGHWSIRKAHYFVAGICLKTLLCLQLLPAAHGDSDRDGGRPNFLVQPVERLARRSDRTSGMHNPSWPIGLELVTSCAQVERSLLSLGCAHSTRYDMTKTCPETSRSLTREGPLDDSCARCRILRLAMPRWASTGSSRRGSTKEAWTQIRQVRMVSVCSRSTWPEVTSKPLLEYVPRLRYSIYQGVVWAALQQTPDGGDEAVAAVKLLARHGKAKQASERLNDNVQSGDWAAIRAAIRQDPDSAAVGSSGSCSSTELWYEVGGSLAAVGMLS